jgi:hypothetical protein
VVPARSAVGVAAAGVGAACDEAAGDGRSIKSGGRLGMAASRRSRAPCVLEVGEGGEQGLGGEGCKESCSKAEPLSREQA